MQSLLTRREAWIWAACFLVVSALLVLTHFTSADPDSTLHANLSARLAAGPAAQWMAPEWWGNWELEGLYREHPAGIFLIPTALGALGLPAIQASYIVGIAAGLACLLLAAHLISRITSPGDGRLALVLLQLTPLAFIFRVRANHEYPMLLCLLVALIGLDGVRRAWRHVWIAPVALTVAVLVKGVFVAVPLLAAGLWVLANPRREPGSIWRPIAACVAGAALIGATAYAYDALYLRATGETFWGPYWARQLTPLTLTTADGGDPTFGPHLRFYLLRMLWHPAPWSFALVAWVWQSRGHLVNAWRALPTRTRRGAAFALTFAMVSVLALSPISRFAERYAFSANYAVAAAGAVTALHIWPKLRAIGNRIDQTVPAFPALVWLGLMLLRLTLGPLLPRISG